MGWTRRHQTQPLGLMDTKGAGRRQGARHGLEASKRKGADEPGKRGIR